MEEVNEVKEVKEIKEVKFDDLLITDPSQICAFIMVKKDLVDNPGDYGFKDVKLSEFKANLNSNGRIETYYLEGHKTAFRREYFESYKQIQKALMMKTNNDFRILFKENTPLIFVFSDNEFKEGLGLFSYVIAPTLRS